MLDEYLYKTLDKAETICYIQLISHSFQVMEGNMNFVLIKEPNVIFECANLLFGYFGGDTCKELKSAIQKKFSIDVEVLNSCFDAIIEAEEYITSGTLEGEDEEKLEYLFSRQNGMRECLATYILYDAFREKEPDFASSLLHVKELSKPIFFLNFSSMLIKEFAPPDFDADIVNYNDLLNFIENMDIPADEKWELCRFFKNFEEYRDYLAYIMEKAGKLFLEKYESIKHYIGWFSSSVNEPFNADSAKFIKENYDIELSEYVDTLFLQPTIMMCNTTKYLMNFSSENEDDFMYVGVLFEPLKEITSDSTLEDKLCRGLRTLGDMRKFEILKLLAESPKYGQQLAKLLDISTATVSHHMSMLIECGFVEIKRNSNRIYYVLNNKKLRAFIDDLSAELISE